MLTSLLTDDRGGKVFLIVLSLVAIIAPLLNIFVPEGNALHVSTYTITLLGKYLAFALLALSVDLVWGYLGIL
ncbi:MAG: urea ABC transporter permease subunit UrtC, partial [Gammaproteobacteria bacterium]|nr:urea ABC transporter permease subunit UrtC [Gammaproteobacteria bacterium]